MALDELDDVDGFGEEELFEEFDENIHFSDDDKFFNTDDDEAEPLDDEPV